MSYTGVLELTATEKGPKTIISDCFYEGALKITRPVYLEEDSPSIYMIDVGGGYVDGDTYRTTVDVEDGAKLAITTQSSTKIYKTPKTPVVQQMTVNLQKGSVLEFLPDPVIAYEQARFSQETVIHMEADACLFYSDIMTPGWSPDGSYFRYDWIRSKLKVYQNGKLVVFDHLMLEPDDEMGGLMQMDGYTHVGMFMIVHPHVDEDFIDRLYETLADINADARFGVSALPVSGVILRILACNTGTIERLITQAHTFARRKLLNKEYVAWRKY
ncbi:urease accessory protein UreD [Desertibacillus haloalkaliphilus]|uniref:urease accessory protein UreD n=1 Tax=Desertibacillus haloalkaliphilus TaxID=1328930 RepID=UPI001C27D7EB|nr:urease accessory protein UreD [Desertibacillus haloalkaliphilus]MBU8906640.1 urease accessory protein UreD [Desertibacillus haloalkaliphilus]